MEYSNNRSVNIWLTKPFGNNIQLYNHASKPFPISEDALQIVKGKALTLRGKGSHETELLSAYEPPSPNIFLSEYSFLQCENDVVIPPPFDKSLCQTRRTTRYFIKPTTPTTSMHSSSDITNDKSDSSKKRSCESQNGNKNEMKGRNSGILNNSAEEDVEKLTSRLRSLSLHRKKKQKRSKKDDLVGKKEKNRDLSSKSAGEVEVEKNNSSSDFNHPSSKKARPRRSKLPTRVKCTTTLGNLPQSETEMAYFSKRSIATPEKKTKVQPHPDSSVVSKKSATENRKTRNKTDGAATKSLRKIQPKTTRISEISNTNTQQKAEDAIKTASPPALLSSGNSSPMTKGKRRALSKKTNRGTAHRDRSSVSLKLSAKAGKSKMLSLRKPMKRQEDIPHPTLRQRRLLKTPGKNEDMQNHYTPSNIQSTLEEMLKNTTKRGSSLSPKLGKKSLPISSPKEHSGEEKAKISPGTSHCKRLSERSNKKDAFQNTSKKARLTRSRKRTSPVRKMKEETSGTSPLLKMSPNTTDKKSSDKISGHNADNKKSSTVSNDAKTTTEKTYPLKSPEKATPTSYDSKAIPTARNKKADFPKRDKKATSQFNEGTASTSDENKFALETSSKKGEPQESDKKKTSQSKDGTASASKDIKSVGDRSTVKTGPPKSDKMGIFQTNKGATSTSNENKLAAETGSKKTEPQKSNKMGRSQTNDGVTSTSSEIKSAGDKSNIKPEPQESNNDGASQAVDGTTFMSNEIKSADDKSNKKAEPPKSDKMGASQTNDGITFTSNENKSATETSNTKTEPPKSDKMGASQTNDGTTSTTNEIKSAGDTTNEIKSAGDKTNTKADPPKSDKKETSQTNDGATSTQNEIKSAGDTTNKDSELPQNKKAVYQSNEGKINLETRKKADPSSNEETKASSPKIIQNQTSPAATRIKKAQDTTNVKKQQPKTRENFLRTTSYNDKLRSSKIMPKTKMASLSPISSKKISPRVNTWRTRPHTNSGDDTLSGWKPRDSNVPEKRSPKTQQYLRKKLANAPSIRTNKSFVRRKAEVVNNVYWEYPALGKPRLPLYRRKVGYKKSRSGQAKQTRKGKRLSKTLPPLRHSLAESENFKLADAFLRRDSDYELDAFNMPDIDGTLQHTSAFQQYMRWTREGGSGMNSQEKADLGTAQGIIEDNEIRFIPQYDVSCRRSESEDVGEKQVFGKYYCQQHAMYWTRQGSLSTDTDLSRKSSLINPHAQEIFIPSVKRNRAHGLPMKTKDHFRILPGSPSQFNTEAPMNPAEHAEGNYLHQSSSSVSSCQCLTTRSSGASRARSAFMHYPRDTDRMYKHYDIFEKPLEERQKNRIKLTQSAELHSESVEFYKYSPLDTAKMQKLLSSEHNFVGADNVITGDPVQVIRYSHEVGITPYPSMEDFNQDQLFDVAERTKQRNSRRRRGVYEYDHQGHRTEKIIMPPRRQGKTSWFRRRTRGRARRKASLSKDLDLFSRKFGFPSSYNRSIARSRSVSSRRHSSPGTVYSENFHDAYDDCHSDSDDGWEDVESEPIALMPRGSIEDVKFEGHGAELFNLLPQPLRYEENLRLLAALNKQNELVKIGKIRRVSQPSVTDASTLCDLGSEFRHLSMPRLSPSVLREKRWLRKRIFSHKCVNQSGEG